MIVSGHQGLNFEGLRNGGSRLARFYFLSMATWDLGQNRPRRPRQDRLGGTQQVFWFLICPPFCRARRSSFYGLPLVRNCRTYGPAPRCPQGRYNDVAQDTAQPDASAPSCVLHSNYGTMLQHPWLMGMDKGTTHVDAKPRTLNTGSALAQLCPGVRVFWNAHLSRHLEAERLITIFKAKPNALPIYFRSRANFASAARFVQR